MVIIKAWYWSSLYEKVTRKYSLLKYVILIMTFLTHIYFKRVSKTLYLMFLPRRLTITPDFHDLAISFSYFPKSMKARQSYWLIFLSSTSLHFSLSFLKRFSIIFINQNIGHNTIILLVSITILHHWIHIRLFRYINFVFILLHCNHTFIHLWLFKRCAMKILIILLDFIFSAINPNLAFSTMQFITLKYANLSWEKKVFLFWS